MASGTQFSPSPIRPLSAEVVARLRSTLTISSLSDAVAELLQNSLDAHARSVRININFSRSSCVVEDDGVGISPNDLPLIGTLNGLDNLRFSMTPQPVG